MQRIYLRPEWVKGRSLTAKGQSKALLFQLLEGQSSFYEGEAASVVQYILDTPIWGEVNLQKVNAGTGVHLDSLQAFFDDLLNQGLLTTEIPKEATILNWRKKVGDHRKESLAQAYAERNSDQSIRKKLPFLVEEPENSYFTWLEENNIPGVVMFELTYNCNEMCVHCFNPGAARNSDEKSLRNKREEINLEHYKELIADLEEMGVVKVILTGGDPFVKPHIWKLLDELSKTNMVFDIYTNGLALLGRVDKIARVWPLSVGFSIYSARPEDHDAITRVPKSLEKSLRVIGEAADFGIPMFFKCPIMMHNAKSYFEVEALAASYGAIAQIDASLTDAIDGDLAIGEQLQVKGDLLQLILRDPNVPLYVGKELPDFGRQTRNREEAFCGAGTMLMNISPEGDIGPCNSFPTRFGNVRERSFKQVWENNKELKDWQAIVINDYEECGTHERCGYCNRCPGQSFIEHGTPLKASTQNCTLAATRLELAKSLAEGHDPLDGRTLEQALTEFEMPKANDMVVTSQKEDSHRNSNWHK